MTGKYTGKMYIRLTLLLVVMLCGCESAYYGAMEKAGVYKRDIFINRVESAQKSQEDAQEDFETVLERFMSIVEVKPGRLEKAYRKLNKSFESAESSAVQVSERIASIEDVSEDLFDEWESEIEIITSEELRSASRQQLSDSRNRYTELIAAMHAAEASMEPVLTTFRDYVLFLKHNLNAQAISSLELELNTIQSDVDLLVTEMQLSIDESRQFIDDMQLLN